MIVNVSEVLERARLNRFHLLVLVLCGMLVTFDGFDMTAISYVAGDFATFLRVKQGLMGLVFSAGAVGTVFGALLFGVLGDRLGSKWGFLLCSVTFGAFTLLTATATSLPTLIGYRFIAGLGIGGAAPLAISLAIDYLPGRLRMPLTMVMYITVTLGAIIAAYAYGYLTVFGWRSVFVVGGAVPILCAPLFFLLTPEKLERLVVKRADPDQIRKLLTRVEPGGSFDRAEFTARAANTSRCKLVQLFQDGRAPITALIWVAYVTSMASLFFFVSWLPALLTDYGLGRPQMVQVASAMQFGAIAGTLISALVVMAMGGFRTIMAGYLCAAIAIVILARGPASFPFLLPTAFVIGLFLTGTQSVLNVTCANAYPSAIRSTGVGWGVGVGRASSTLSPLIAGLLLTLRWRPPDLFLLAAGPTLCASLAGAGALLVLRQRAAGRQTVPRATSSAKG